MKPSNIILEEEKDRVIIIDLGIANKNIVCKKTSEANKGTFYFRAPEMHEGNLSPSVDIWAFGCILLEITSGKIPYEDITQEHLLRKKLLVDNVNPYSHLINTDRDAAQWIIDNPDF